MSITSSDYNEKTPARNLFLQDVQTAAVSGAEGAAETKDEAFVRIVGDLGPLPTLPQIYVEITEMVKKPNASMRDIGKIIAKDVGMTARVLQLVNSAYFGLRRKIASPEEAAVFIGLDTVKAMVLSLAVFSQADEQGLPKGYIDELWDHSFATANFARVIALSEGFERTQIDEAFTAAMLHDIGRVVLIMRRKKEYAAYLGRLAQGEKDTLVLEVSIFGLDHAQVGAFLLGSWGLPDVIVESVLKHHALLPGDVKELDTKALTHIANAFALELTGSKLNALHAERLNTELLAHLGCEEKTEQWRTLCRRCLEV